MSLLVNIKNPSFTFSYLVHRRIQLILWTIANLLVYQGLGFDYPESSVCVAALATKISVPSISKEYEFPRFWINKVIGLLSNLLFKRICEFTILTLPLSCR